MTNINFVSLTNMLPATKEFCAVTYLTRWWSNEDWEKYTKEMPNFYCEKTTRKFWEETLKGFKPEEFYFFITQTELTPVWEGFIDEYNIRKHMVWKSRSPAENYNYPEEGPRLTAYLFKGFNSNV